MKYESSIPVEIVGEILFRNVDDLHEESKKIKYEFVCDDTIEYDGRILTRIRAIRNIEKHNVCEGDLGGYIDGEIALRQNGDAWVPDGFVSYFIPKVVKAIL